MLHKPAFTVAVAY